MSDYISRDAVQALLKKWADGYSYVEVPTESAIKAIKSIPAADVRPVVRGKWVRCRKNYSKCSECGTAYNHPVDWTPDKYCSECGARLFEEE